MVFAPMSTVFSMAMASSTRTKVTTHWSPFHHSGLGDWFYPFFPSKKKSFHVVFIQVIWLWSSLLLLSSWLCLSIWYLPYFLIFLPHFVHLTLYFLSFLRLILFFLCHTFIPSFFFINFSFYNPESNQSWFTFSFIFFLFYIYSFFTSDFPFSYIVFLCCNNIKSTPVFCSS